MARPLTERLNRVADRSTLRLAHHGRKTGNAYVVTIWFAVDGEAMYLGTMNRQRQWVRNVLKTPRVRLEVGGEHFDGEVEAVTANTEQLLRAYELFARKYWVMWALDWGLALTGRNPRTSKKLDAGRGGYFRVRLTQPA